MPKGIYKRRNGSGGIQGTIKRVVIKNPKASTERICAILERKGYDANATSVSTIRSGTLQTLRMVKELGVPRGAF